MIETLTIRRLQSGGIITNYDCASSCAHCLYRSGPHRDAEYISDERVREVCAVVRRLGCDSVHIGGGEPFAQPDRLARVLELARDEDVHVEYVETNSQWFTDLDEATALLYRYRELGLGQLLVSVSPFHNAAIPFRRVKGVLAACRQTGISPMVWVPGFLEECDAFDDSVPHRLVEYEERFGPDYLSTVPGRYWVHLGGRALATFGRILGRKNHESILGASRGGCRELSQTDHFHIDLYGSYVPGLCAGLAIRMVDLGEPLDEATHPLLCLLYSGGIRGLYEWAVATHDFTPRESGYLSKCDLCDHMRRHLVRECGLDSAELQPRGFYS
ncbi:MAG: radical SAM protein [Deltaproteobacteria bacterium]|nr:radical SAM protein [Deltaproteobacteria bacterium]